MSNLVRNIFLMLIVWLPFSLNAQTAYESDTVDFFVSDNAANDALEEVNFIMCMMNAMGFAEMVNRGPYKISLYEDDCKSADTSSSDAAAAKPKSAQSAQSTKKSESGATGSTAKTVTVAYANVTRASNSSPQIANAWVELAPELEDWAEDMSQAQLSTMPDAYSPAITVYIKMTTTSPPSATSQFGLFDMQMSFALGENQDMCGSEFPGSTEDKLEAGCLMLAGSSAGGARIKASGGQITYVSYTMNDAPLRTVLSYSGDKIEGVTVDTTGYEVGSFPNQEWVEMEVMSGFSIDNGDAAVYCSKVISAATLDFEDASMSAEGFFIPGSTAVTLPDSNSGLTTAETCYSLKDSDAQKNIHRYGVYNVDGTRATLSGQAAFPMNATVEDADGNDVELFGWADYWNIYVDDWENPGLWDADTVWTKEQFAGETGPALQIKIASANQRVTKYTKSYLALNDLDKLTMVSWISGNDDRWGSAYQSLGFPAVEREYEGSYNKANATWTFTKSIDWSSGWNETTLGTPITFTNTEYLAAMSVTYEDPYTQKQPAMNGLQLNTWRIKVTDYLQGDTLSASATENVQYWWLGGVNSGTFGGYPWGKDSGDGPGIDLENLLGLINGTANARPIKVKGYFGNLPNSGSGSTNIVVKLTHGDDSTRSGTEDQVTFTLPFAWSSTGSSMTMSIAQGTTISGIYNDGGTAANVNVNLTQAISETFSMNSDGDAAFEVQFNSILKDLKSMTASFASFFSDGQQVNVNIDFGALDVYTAESQSDAADAFGVTLTVKSAPDANAADAWTEERGFWAWSPDTGNGYDIPTETFQNPTDNTSTYGIQVESRQELTPADYPAKFKCVFFCTSAATINATADAAKALNGSLGTVVSPHIPTTVQYVKSGDQQGYHYPGILATDVVTYTPDGLGIKDGSGNVMGFASTITENDVSTANFKNIPQEYYTEELAWGIRTGRMLGGTDAEIATELAKLECNRSDNSKPLSDTNKYRDTHPVFSANATRYCEDAFWEGTGPTTWYELEFGASEWQRKKYAKDTATGNYVNFARPETLYYAVPDDATAYTKDAGKNVRLEFGGFGELWGIPGQVINVLTGEALGEFYDGEWNDNLRYVQRFALEAYNGVDPVLTKKGSDTTYKVKALEGEQWLAKKDAALGTLSYSKTAEDLPPFSDIQILGPKDMNGEDNAGSIGLIPTTGLFNDGKPSVIHGEVVATLD